MSTVIDEKQALANLADNIKTRLVELGWSQGDLARAIQVGDEDLQATRMRVSRYCNARIAPHPATLSNIAEVLEVTTDWLLSTPKARKRKKSA